MLSEYREANLIVERNKVQEELGRSVMSTVSELADGLDGNGVTFPLPVSQMERQGDVQ